MSLKEFRCSKCNKLLGKIDGRAEIVCTRCKVMNVFGVPPEVAELIDTPEVGEQFETFKRMHTPKIVDELHNYSTREQALTALANMDRRVIHDTLKGESRDDQVVRDS